MKSLLCRPGDSPITAGRVAYRNRKANGGLAVTGAFSGARISRCSSSPGVDDCHGAIDTFYQRLRRAESGY